MRRVAQVAAGGLLAAVVAGWLATLARPAADPKLRSAPPHLTFTGLNDLAPLRQRLARDDAAPDTHAPR